MKGLSPLIAEVLLIAFVVGIGAIIITWVTGFTKSSTKTVSQQSNAQIACTRGSIKFLTNPPLTYNTTSGNLTGTVENDGLIGLGNLRLQIIYNNSTLQEIPLSPSQVSPGGMVSFNVRISSNYQLVKVMTNCTSPEVSDEATSSEIVSTS